MRTSLKLGPGEFTIGAGALAVEAQLTNIRIEWTENVATTGGEATNFLDGTTDTDPADETVTFSAVVSGNVQQDDLAEAGFTTFTWANKGTEQPFTFRPRDDLERIVTGVCKPVPVTIGGDVKVKNRSDFSFRCVGDPVLGVPAP